MKTLTFLLLIALGVPGAARAEIFHQKVFTCGDMSGPMAIPLSSAEEFSFSPEKKPMLLVDIYAWIAPTMPGGHGHTEDESFPCKAHLEADGSLRLEVISGNASALVIPKSPPGSAFPQIADVTVNFEGKPYQWSGCILYQPLETIAAKYGN